MKRGDKLKCLNEILNPLGQPLFIKDEVYDVLYVDNEKFYVMVCLNHILYANEYNSFPIDWILENFKKI
jgi:hypothetical protein